MEARETLVRIWRYWRGVPDDYHELVRLAGKHVLEREREATKLELEDRQPPKRGRPPKSVI